MGNEEEAKEKKRVLTKLTCFAGSGYRGIQSDDDYVSEYSSNFQLSKPDTKEISYGFKKNKHLEGSSGEEEEETEEEIEEEEEISEKPTMEETVTSEDNEIPYIFHWNEGGTNVKLIGSFSKWKETYTMTQDPKDKIYKITLKLKRGKYEYKFIVDDKWRYSTNQQKIKDPRGNTNNFIDLTDYNIIKNLKNSINNKQVTKKVIIKKKIKKLRKKRNKSKKKRNIEDNNEENIEKTGGYGCIFPRRNTFTEDANSKQDNYKDCFKINEGSNQKYIGREKYFKYKKNECFNGEKSFLPLLYSPHVNLNHTLTKCNNGENLVEIGLSSRFRDKDCTFVYYSHLDD